TKDKSWYPCEKVQVDVPTYDVEGADGKIGSHGTYLIPVVWNNRILIFFPQFAKKTAPQDPGTSITVPQDSNGLHVPVNKPTDYWEIKMAWSEYRNGKWTQKQLSAQAIYESPIPSALPWI